MLSKLCLPSFRRKQSLPKEGFPMTTTSAGLTVDPAAETIDVGALTVRFLVTGENSSGSVAIFELTVPAGQRLMAPAHSHDRYEETICGVEGVLTWTVDGKAIDVGPGQALCIPRGAVHRFDNNSSAQDVKALCVITPAVLGPEYFRGVREIARAAGGGPPDRAKMIELMLRHGLTPAPPQS
jgi:quercetin dioxygenase-like cupin family protein